MAMESRAEKKKKAQRSNSDETAPARKTEGRSRMRIAGFRQPVCGNATMDTDNYELFLCNDA